MSSKFTSETTVQDIFNNPADYGAPSFAEFKRNPDKFRKGKEHLFAQGDKGSKILGKVIQKHIYYMDGVKCENLEHAQRIMGDMGIDPDTLEMRIGLEDIGQQKAIAHVHYRPKRNIILPEDI